MTTAIKDAVRHGLTDLRFWRPKLRRVLDRAGEAGGYILGGAIRHWHLNGMKKEPRDLDLVFAAEEDLNLVFEDHEYQTTSLGGRRYVIENKTVDAWTFANSWAVRHRFVPPTIQGVVSGVFSSIDAVAYRLGTRDLIDAGYIWTTISRQIRPVLLESSNPPLAIMKVMVMAERYDLGYVPSMAKAINEWRPGYQLRKLRDERYPGCTLRWPDGGENQKEELV